MLRSELLMLMISKASLMLNGKSFTISSEKFMKLEPKLSSLNFPLVTSPLNGSLIVESSVLVESLKTTSTELPSPLEPFYRPLSTTSRLMFWELVVNSKKNKLEPKDSTCSKNAQAYFFLYLDKISHHYFERRCRTIHQRSREIPQRCNYDCEEMFQDQQGGCRWRSH